LRRPWNVVNESERICRNIPQPDLLAGTAFA
jgi:hypothetical protein